MYLTKFWHYTLKKNYGVSLTCTWNIWWLPRIIFSMVDLVGGFVVTLVKQVTNNCREVCILWPNRFLIPEILSMIDSDYFKNKQPLHKKYYPSSGWII